MRWRHALIAMLIAAVLGGCASTGTAAFNQAAADCQSHAGKDGMRCMKNHPSFGQFPANNQRFLTYAAVVEEQRNAGKITPAEADLLVSEYNAKLGREAAAAEAAQQAALNQSLGQTGATLLAIDAMNRNRAPVYTAPPPPMMRTTNCNAMGNTLNCTTF